MVILITGITGLIGSHLAEYLLRTTHHSIVGLVRVRGNIQHIAQIRRHKRLNIIEGSVDDGKAIYDAIRRTKPKIIIHLAAQSFPNESWEAPISTIHTNVTSTIHILETVRRLNPNIKVLIACSAAEYGAEVRSKKQELRGGKNVILATERRPESYQTDSGQAGVTPFQQNILTAKHHPPFTEDRILQPLHPYGISKVAQELLGYQYHVNFGIPTYLPRFFIQAGPRQDERISIQTFAKQIAEAEAAVIPSDARKQRSALLADEGNCHSGKRSATGIVPDRLRKRFRTSRNDRDSVILASEARARPGSVRERFRTSRNDTIKVGNLNSYRDILDVRDGVAAIWAILQKGKPGTPYNVCSNKAYKLQFILDSLLKLSRVPLTVTVEKKRLRPSDEPVILGTHARLTRHTGWKPHIPIEKTLKNILDYWREKTKLCFSS